MTRETPDVEAMFGIDMAAAVDGVRRMTDQPVTLQDRITGPVGRAVTPDGRIRLAFSPEHGLPELHIDPRAMRMGAGRLAETIRRLAAEAIADLAERRQAAAGEERTGAIAPDPEAVRETFDGVSDVMRRTATDATDQIHRVSARLER